MPARLGGTACRLGRAVGRTRRACGAECDPSSAGGTAQASEGTGRDRDATHEADGRVRPAVTSGAVVTDHDESGHQHLPWRTTHQMEGMPWTKIRHLGAWPTLPRGHPSGAPEVVCRCRGAGRRSVSRGSSARLPLPMVLRPWGGGDSFLYGAPGQSERWVRARRSARLRRDGDRTFTSTPAPSPGVASQPRSLSATLRTRSSFGPASM